MAVTEPFLIAFLCTSAVPSFESLPVGDSTPVFSLRLLMDITHLAMGF